MPRIYLSKKLNLQIKYGLHTVWFLLSEKRYVYLYTHALISSKVNTHTV